MSTATACFSMTGAALTEIARNLLLEDEPGRAYRLLADSLIGDGAAEAGVWILRGERDLVGDSNVGMDLVAAKECDELARFKTDMRYIYAGRYKHRRGWIRPVAMMTGLGPVDADWANEKARVVGSREWHQLRARFYTEHGGEAEALDVPGEGCVWVLFEPCSERPHWERPPISTQAALDESLVAGRRLERRDPLRAPELLVEITRRPRKRDAEREREEEREQERRDAEWAARLVKIGEDVRARAGDDTFILDLKDGRKLTVPRAPFVRWALCRTDLRDTAPAWENVASSGIKMPLDNPDHTDWVLGAGLELSDAYQDVVSEPAWELVLEIQSKARKAMEPKRKFAGIFDALEKLKHAQHDAAVIVDAGECTGVVGVDIAVLPDAQGHRVSEVGECKGVIVEKGGPLAHLIIVSRGRGVTVMRFPGACERFRTGMTVTLNPAAGRITIIDDAPSEATGSTS